MKERIKIDTSILFGVIFLTLILFRFPQLYPRNLIFSDVLTFLGLWVVLLGTFFRMSARAHKKARSDQGHGLVTTGPYSLVRNPMYLGTFLIGVGFLLIVWPIYLLPVFIYVFFARFNIQIQREENHLRKFFGESYESYLRDVPRVLPNINHLKRMSFKTNFPLKEIWETKERNGVLVWPLLVFALEVYHQYLVFGVIHWIRIVWVIAVSFVTFLALLWVLYKNEQNSK